MAAENAALRGENQQLRDENARLKGGSGKLDSKPSVKPVGSLPDLCSAVTDHLVVLERIRYLSVFFVYKPDTVTAIIMSARDMTDKERRSYGRK